MGNLKFNRDGMIIGGDCDREHRHRRQREKGSQVYLNYLEVLGKIKTVGQSIIFKTKTSRSFPSPFQMKRDGIFVTMNDELGAYRFIQAIEGLFEKKIYKISKKKLDNLINDTQACSPYTGEVQQDHMYKKRKKRGEFEVDSEV